MGGGAQGRTKGGTEHSRKPGPPESKPGGSEAKASNKPLPEAAQERLVSFSSQAQARPHLDHLTKKSVLLQELVQSFNFLFLLRAAELQVLDLGGQLYIHLFQP